jgi:penicillin-binding protein 1B
MTSFLDAFRNTTDVNHHSCICRTKWTTQLRKTAFLSIFLILGLPKSALAFNWPFKQEEFNKKLSAQQLAPIVRFYARGPTFLPGQSWDEQNFQDLLRQQNYRLRGPEQALLAGDALRLEAPQCLQLFTHLAQPPALSHCWLWKNKNNTSYFVFIASDSTIERIQSGEDRRDYWKASLEATPLAQFRSSQPIMQNTVPLSEIPVLCLNAVMAIEDSEFLTHGGLSYIGLTRSLVKNIRQMRYAQGGSTITQQLVKNYFLTPEKTLKRKITELYLATRLESEWTKNQILETYLNIIYMGQSGSLQVIGYSAAAQHYFNKSISDLNLAECSLLAAIVNNPGLYNPWKQKERAGKRRELVLSKMLELNLISEIEAAEARLLPLPAMPPPLPTETAPYYIEAAQRQLLSLDLPDISMNIYTSLDLQVQKSAQQALQNHLKNLTKNKKSIAKNKERGLSLEGLVLLGENHSGLLTAVVGGQNYRLTQYNRALNSQRQIGSLLKPFIYLAALTQKIISPDSTLEDSPFTWNYDSQSWTPSNYDRKFRGAVPAYYALKESLNIPAARLAQKVGLNQLIQTANSAGLTSKIDSLPASSLGTSQHFPQEVFDAYRTLANGGQSLRSGFIERVESVDGATVYYEHNPQPIGVLPRAESSQIVFMMKQTLQSGTAQSASQLGWNRQAAGKTGTTSHNRDAWFAGFTPQHTAVVWLGYDQPQTSQLTGASGALPVWVELMQAASAKWPDRDFLIPLNTELREVTLFDTKNKVNLLYKK